MRAILIALAALSVTTGAAAGRASEPKIFQIPGHGSLRLEVPDGWITDSLPLKDPASVTVHLMPGTGEAFDIRITAVWLDPRKLAKTTAESLKTDVLQAAKGLLGQSIEKTATLLEIRGPESAGHYYTLTDRKPGPGEFKYLTQGSFLTGQILSAFTILHRAAAPPEVSEALRTFATATHVR